MSLTSLLDRTWRVVFAVAVAIPAVVTGDDGEVTLPATFVEGLPAAHRASILFAADHEDGNLEAWTRPNDQYPGGGVFTTGPSGEAVAQVSVSHSFTGQHGVEASIRGAVRGSNGVRAVRLMRWTDRPWDRGGDYFPKSAFYSAWMFVPQAYNSNKYAPWDPGDGGWWNVFQFKANDENDVSQSIWSVNLYYDDDRQQMEFGLFSQVNAPGYIGQTQPIPVPVGRWFHLEARYTVSSNGSGSVAVWQDGASILSVENVDTALTSENENAVWGIGNYTDHVAVGGVEGDATLYFDDAAVSTMPLHTALPQMPWVPLRVQGILVPSSAN